MKNQTPKTLKARLEASRVAAPACTVEPLPQWESGQVSMVPGESTMLCFYLRTDSGESWVCKLEPELIAREATGRWLVHTRKRSAYFMKRKLGKRPWHWEHALTLVARHVTREIDRYAASTQKLASRLERLNSLQTTALLRRNNR